MSDRDSENNFTGTEHILFFKEQVERFAAKIKHRHLPEDIEGLDNVYAPKNHVKQNTEYGIGNTTYYGHVRVNDNVNEGSGDDTTNSDNTAITTSMPVSNNGIATYVKKKINALETKLRNDLQSSLNIITSEDKLSSKKNEDLDRTKNQYNIPTTKAVWDAISSYKDLLVGVDLARPQQIDTNINKIRSPGYYKQIGNRHFSYGGKTVYYTNALIKVEKQANRVIQHVYATNKITTNEGPTYKINGTEYVRWGLTEDNWGAWHVAHQPYTKTTRATKLGANVDKDSVVVYENTAGFIIHWDQDNSRQDEYPVTANLYEYATVCEFNPPLPIRGPYVFGNLIGRMDIKITSNKMQIRSNVPKGGRIIEMHETYFVPRNQ